MSKLLACIILLAAFPIYAAQFGCVPVGECANGTGTYYFGNGDRYEGKWKDNNRIGKGIYYFANGDRYEGEWKDGIQYGQVTYYFANGDRYEGGWKLASMDGQGTYYHANGERYEGEWKYDTQHGQGTYYFANGDRYEGEWKNHRQHGQGTYYFANGDHYKGEWVDGERESVVVCVLSVCFAAAPWIYDVRHIALSIAVVVALFLIFYGIRRKYESCMPSAPMEQI